MTQKFNSKLKLAQSNNYLFVEYHGFPFKQDLTANIMVETLYYEYVTAVDVSIANTSFGLSLWCLLKSTERFMYILRCQAYSYLKPLVRSGYMGGVFLYSATLGQFGHPVLLHSGFTWVALPDMGLSLGSWAALSLCEQEWSMLGGAVQDRITSVNFRDYSVRLI